jgi:hypothetical protein
MAASVLQFPGLGSALDPSVEFRAKALNRLDREAARERGRQAAVLWSTGTSEEMVQHDNTTHGLSLLVGPTSRRM